MKIKSIVKGNTENGRITISGNTLKITEDKTTKVNDEFLEEEYERVLLKWFNIEETKIEASH